VSFIYTLPKNSLQNKKSLKLKVLRTVYSRGSTLIAEKHFRPLFHAFSPHEEADQAKVVSRTLRKYGIRTSQPLSLFPAKGLLVSYRATLWGFRCLKKGSPLFIYYTPGGGFVNKILFCR
jgi:hypothetical protein